MFICIQKLLNVSDVKFVLVSEMMLVGSPFPSVWPSAPGHLLLDWPS